jgi:type IV fimbrial biogenesis protein FimT
MFESTTGRTRDWTRVAGFTLIELMITLSVAGVLLAIAVPSFNQMIIANRLATQSNEIVAAVSLARSEAIKRNASVTLCRVQTNNGTACVAGSGNWENWIVRAGAGTIVQRGAVNTYGGTFIVTSTLNIDQVVFGPDGLARTNGTIIATDAENNQIRLCSTRLDDNNVRSIELGAGSRVSTTIEDDEGC